MPVTITGIVEDVQTYQGKNGFGANITMSTLIDKRRKSITFNSNDKGTAQKFEENLQKQISIKIMLNQSNFGLRLGDILEIKNV